MGRVPLCKQLWWLWRLPAQQLCQQSGLCRSRVKPAGLIQFICGLNGFDFDFFSPKMEGRTSAPPRL